MAGVLTFLRGDDRMDAKITRSEHIYKRHKHKTSAHLSAPILSPLSTLKSPQISSADTTEQPQIYHTVTLTTKNESIFIKPFLIDFLTLTV